MGWTKADKERQKEREDSARGEWGTLWVSNGLHHQEARQKGNGMIAPHHPSFSLLPPSLFLAVPRPSIRQYLLWPVLCPPRSPFTTSRDLLLSSGRSSLIHYAQERRWRDGGGSGGCIWSGSLMRGGGQRGGRGEGEGKWICSDTL